MTVRNGMPFLKDAVESILNQTFDDYNFIIVDDGSTDGSRLFLESLSNDRIKIYSINATGVIAALNFGLEKVRTEYVALMDSDDVSHPDRIQKQINFLSCHPDHVLVGTAINYIGVVNNNRKFSIKFPANNENVVRGLKKQKYVVAHPSVMIRTKSVKEIGGYDSTSYPLPDADMFLRLAQKGKLANLRDILCSVRLRENSFTSKNLYGILKTYFSFKKKEITAPLNLIGKISVNMNYYSQYLYKKALVKYLNGKSILWLLLLSLAALLYFPKAIYFIRKKIVFKT